MKLYYVEYNTTKNGVDYSKWLASINYEHICQDMLKMMKGGGYKTYQFGVSFILTLVACFESNLNDWLIIDTFEKHGIDNYEEIVNGYISLGPKTKYRVAVSVMTDNTFQIREDSNIVKDLDELIDVRNRFVHPKPRFYYKITKHKTRPKKQRMQDHPFCRIRIADCRRYHAAVRHFDQLFCGQYDRGIISENRLIKEIQKNTPIN
jgi:hypothetical protein